MGLNACQLNETLTKAWPSPGCGRTLVARVFGAKTLTRPSLKFYGRVLWTSQVIDFIDDFVIRPKRPKPLNRCAHAHTRTRAQAGAQGRTLAHATRKHGHFGRT